MSNWVSALYALIVTPPQHFSTLINQNGTNGYTSIGLRFFSLPYRQIEKIGIRTAQCDHSLISYRIVRHYTSGSSLQYNTQHEQDCGEMGEDPRDSIGNRTTVAHFEKADEQRM